MGSKDCGGMEVRVCNHHPETCTCRWKDEEPKEVKTNTNIKEEENGKNSSKKITKQNN